MAFVQRRRLGPIASRKQQHWQRQELKQQCGSVVNMFKTEARADRLALLGELSAGLFERATIAHGNLSTLRALTNPIRRLAAPRELLHDDLTPHVLEHEFQTCSWPMFGRQGKGRQGLRA